MAEQRNVERDHDNDILVPANEDTSKSTNHQQQCIALVLGDCLSTTLGVPVVSFCSPSTVGALPRKFLRVQMYGSGVEVIPFFNFDQQTTIRDLFVEVQNRLAKNEQPWSGDVFTVRLFIKGDVELVNHENVFVEQFFEGNGTVYVIARDEAQIETTSAFPKQPSITM